MQKLEQRMEIPLETIFVRCSVPDHYQDNAKKILLYLAKILHQDSNKLRHDESLSSVFIVYKEEIPEKWQIIWKKEGFAQECDYFSYNFYEYIDEHTSVEDWEKIWKSCDPQPKNEDDLIDWLISLQICELLNLLSPVLIYEERKNTSISA